MSLVAALLVAGTSAFAIDNVKVSGDAKLYYSTAKTDISRPGQVSPKTPDLFSKDASIGQAELGLGITSDLTKGVSAGVHATVLSTLGLENNLVSGVWAGNITPGQQFFPNTWQNGQQVSSSNTLSGSNGTAWWIDQAWIAGTVGKTTGKIGRMELDTPLAFTEKWNIAENTFEAAVLINQDIPDTTLVAAYVGASNGNPNSTVNNAQNGTTPFVGYTTYNSGAADILGPVKLKVGASAFGGAGAYGFGVVNNSVKPLTVQGWYYDVMRVADAYWLQADVNMDGLLFGAQYANMKLKNHISTNIGDVMDVNNFLVKKGASSTFKKTTDAYGLMAGYALKDVATFKVAYSDVADDGLLTIQNTATGAQSKLYTEAWWNYGIVGQAGATSYMLSAEANAAGIDLLAQYTHSDVQHKQLPGDTNAKAKFDEVALTASKSFGPLDTTLAYVYSKMQNSADNFIHGADAQGRQGTYKSNMIQAYLTLNF